MVNRDVAKVFSQIADLLEIGGQDRFRVSAYRSAARTVDDLAEDLTAIAARKELLKVPGIG